MALNYAYRYIQELHCFVPIKGFTDICHALRDCYVSCGVESVYNAIRLVGLKRNRQASEAEVVSTSFYLGQQANEN